MLYNNIREVLNDFLSKEKTFIVLDATLPGVALPEHLLTNTRVSLALSHKFKYHTHLTETGVATVLSFNGEETAVFIPYHSIKEVRITDQLYVEESYREEFLKEIQKKVLQSEEDSAFKEAFLKMVSDLLEEDSNNVIEEFKIEEFEFEEYVTIVTNKGPKQ